MGSGIPPAPWELDPPKGDGYGGNAQSAAVERLMGYQPAASSAAIPPAPWEVSPPAPHKSAMDVLDDVGRAGRRALGVLEPVGQVVSMPFRGLGMLATTAQEAIAGPPDSGTRIRQAPDSSLFDRITGSDVRSPSLPQLSLEGYKGMAQLAAGTADASKPGGVAGEEDRYRQAVKTSHPWLSRAEAIAEPIAETGLSFATDPALAGFGALGELGAAGKTAAVAARSGFLVPEALEAAGNVARTGRIASTANRALGAAITPGMAAGAWDRLREARSSAAEHGILSPEALRAGVGGALEAGIAGLAGFHAAHGEPADAFRTSASPVESLLDDQRAAREAQAAPAATNPDFWPGAVPPDTAATRADLDAHLADLDAIIAKGATPTGRAEAEAKAAAADAEQKERATREQVDTLSPLIRDMARRATVQPPTEPRIIMPEPSAGPRAWDPNAPPAPDAALESALLESLRQPAGAPRLTGAMAVPGRGKEFGLSPRANEAVPVAEPEAPPPSIEDALRQARVRAGVPDLQRLAVESDNARPAAPEDARPPEAVAPASSIETPVLPGDGRAPVSSAENALDAVRGVGAPSSADRAVPPEPVDIGPVHDLGRARQLVAAAKNAGTSTRKALIDGLGLSPSKANRLLREVETSHPKEVPRVEAPAPPAVQAPPPEASRQAPALKTGPVDLDPNSARNQAIEATVRQMADVLRSRDVTEGARVPMKGEGHNGPGTGRVEGYLGAPSVKKSIGLDHMAEGPKEILAGMKRPGSRIYQEVRAAAESADPFHFIQQADDIAARQERAPERRQEAQPVAEDHRVKTRRAIAEQYPHLQPEAHEAIAAERERAETDPLTGLPNRLAYQRLVADHEGAVVSMDLGGLGFVNDKLGGGHDLGDAFLKAFADVAREVMADEPDVTITRGGAGSDEFMALVPDTETGARIGQRIQDRFAQAVFSGTRDGKPVHYTGGRADYGVGEASETVESDRGPTSAKIADADLYRRREEARAQGLRAERKGDRPPGLRELPGPGESSDLVPAPEQVAEKSNFFQDAKDRLAARETERGEFMRSNGAVSFEAAAPRGFAEGREGRVIASPSTTEPGAWRLTRIENGEPTGHLQFDTYEKMLEAAQSEFGVDLGAATIEGSTEKYATRKPAPGQRGLPGIGDDVKREDAARERGLFDEQRLLNPDLNPETLSHEDAYRRLKLMEARGEPVDWDEDEPLGGRDEDWTGAHVTRLVDSPNAERPYAIAKDGAHSRERYQYAEGAEVALQRWERDHAGMVQREAMRNRGKFGLVEKTKAGEQRLIPGTLDAAASARARPTEGREAEGPLFTQERDQAVREDKARQRSIGDDEGEKYGTRKKPDEPYVPELTAFHNITPGEILKADKLVGLPMPSIAITKGHVQEGYGPITLVAKRETIDPKANSANRAWPSDAYTGRFPRTEFKVNKKNLDAFLASFPRKEFEEHGGDTSKLEQGPEEALYYAKNSNALRAAFLREKGIKAEPVRGVSGADEMPLGGMGSQPAIIDYVKSHMNIADKYAWLPDDGPERRELSRLAHEALEENVARMPERARARYRQRAEENLFEEDGLLSDRVSRMVVENARRASVPEFSRYKTDDAISEAIKPHEAAFEEWAARKIEPLYDGEFIRVGRKKVPVTLETVIDAMRRSSRAGAEDTMTFGPGNARAVTNKPFASVDQMRAARDKIVPGDKFREWKDQQEQRHNAMAEKLMPAYKGGSTWDSLDNMYRAVAAYIKGGGGDSPDRMNDALRRYDFAPSKSGIEAAIKVAHGIETAPTEYFEAKPARAVPLEEFAGAIVPHDAPENVKEALKRRGLEVREYQGGDLADRQRVADEFTTDRGVKFRSAPNEEATPPAASLTREAAQRVINRPLREAEGAIGAFRVGPVDVRIERTGDLSVNPQAFAAGHPGEAPETAVGSYKRVGNVATLRVLGKDTAGMSHDEVRTLTHEKWHLIRDLGLLSDKQLKAVEREHGADEEAQADAFADWNPRTTPHGPFERIADFFRKIYRSFAPNADSVFEYARSGDVLDRQPTTKIRPIPPGAKPGEKFATGPDENGRMRAEIPTQDEIVSVLRDHPLVKLREQVKRAFLVGSQATGETRRPGEGKSDVDILLEVKPRPGVTPQQLEEKYRQALRQHFVKNNIRGVDDSQHPQWDGHRVDTYFTYDADAETRPKVLLEKGPKYATAPPAEGGDEDRKPLVDQNVDKLRSNEEETPGARPATLSRDEVKHKEQLLEEAKELSGQPDAYFYRQLKKGVPLDDAETVAWRERVDGKEAARNAAQDALEAAKKNGQPTEALEKDFVNKSMDHLKALAAKVEGGTLHGRALQAHTVLDRFDSKSPESVATKLLKAGIDKESIADVMAALRRGDPQEINKALQRAFKPSLSDKLYEAWISGMLSAPSTTATKTVSDLLSLVGGGVERGVASRADAARARWTNSPQERVAGEAWAHYGGMKESVWDAFSNARKAWNEEPTSIDSKGLDPLDQGRAPYAIGGAAGKIIRAGYGGGGTRALRAVDAFSKTLARSAEKRVQALRIATQEGGTRAQVAARAEEIARTPDEKLGALLGAKKANSVLDSMDEYMNRATYTAPYGPRMTKIVAGINEMPGGDIIFPFMRVPWNLTVQAARATPMNLVKVLHEIRSGKLKGGEASEALVRPVLGTAAMAGVALAAAAGQVTGNGPEDPNARKAWIAAGNQAYSVKTPAGWVSYKKIEPFATIIGLAADTVEATHEKKKTAMAAKAVAALEAAFTQKTFLTGMEDIGGILKDPGRYGKQYLQDLESSVVPNIAAKAAQALDPTVRDTSIDKADDILRPIEARIPGLSQGVPAKGDLAGMPVERGGTAAERFVSPFYRSADPSKFANLEGEMARLGYAPGQPSRDFKLPNGKSVELTDQEYDRLMKARERAAEAASRAVQSPSYKAALDTPADAPLGSPMGRFEHTKEAIIRQYFDRASQEFRSDYGQRILRRARQEGLF